ncbi:MAG TPA: transcriptional repressor LexA [Candidatus Hydrogenedens sp.]|nr:transcriptional repressor LexA [Candidatus Hydrogenedens sp.]
MSEKELTHRQKEVLKCIRDFQEQLHYSPSILEICERLRIRSTNGVAGHIRALIRKGYVERSSKARSLKLTTRAQWLFQSLDNRMVPLLGRISAGSPFYVEENVEQMIPFNPNRKTDGVFALKVTGESMIEAGIFDGDIIFVDSKKIAHSGDIVVALINDEVTVKKFYPREKFIELKPANRKMKPIRVPANQVIIQGVVIGLQRNYE